MHEDPLTKLFRKIVSLVSSTDLFELSLNYTLTYSIDVHLQLGLSIDS